MDFLRELELAERRDEQDRIAKLEAAKAKREAQGESADDATASADTMGMTTKRTTSRNRDTATCPKPSEDDARSTQEAAHHLAGILRAAEIEQEQTQSSLDEEKRRELALAQLSGTKRHNFEWQSAGTAAPKRRKIQVAEVVPETVESLLPGIVATIAARASKSTAVGPEAVAVKADETSPEATVVKADDASPEEHVEGSPVPIKNSVSTDTAGNEVKPKGKGKAEEGRCPPSSS
ncbi:hypothetical protein D9611_001059 [Ephemerocybe angulata]|uniref:Uncharacterized protein n=1 Tax=Ephemerocybe angulata TaxID=980116 RepID=A0A8H5BPB2_9AGAR|nr:hypothetical protein D9611_001059 [Tulosesus angulatus]